MKSRNPEILVHPLPPPTLAGACRVGLPQVAGGARILEFRDYPTHEGAPRDG